MHCEILQISVKKHVRYLVEFIIQQVIIDLTPVSFLVQLEIVSTTESRGQKGTPQLYQFNP